MPLLLGIDLGTSSLKALATDEHGSIRAACGREYPILTPVPGYAEQNPSDWWIALCSAVQEIAQNVAVTDIAGIGLSGQMHGCVLLGKTGEPSGNAIIWADQRSREEVREIAAIFGSSQLEQKVGTAPAAGFMAATLRWLQKHDPSRLERVTAVLLPKDYLCYRLTGSLHAEISDASATALFDVSCRSWSEAAIAVLRLPRHIFPALVQSSALVGALTPEAARGLGLPSGIPVVAGAADQPAQAVGNGLIDPGMGSITIGTGGQVFLPMDTMKTDPALHSFCHGPTDRWYLLGASLAAGLSLHWFRDLLGETTDPLAYARLSAEAARVETDGLIFLPYLIGERSPLMDPDARGAFVGLRLHHGRGHLARAIMEGVAFSLRQIVDRMRAQGIAFDQALASGGGLAAPFWRQMVADVTRCTLNFTDQPERAAVGAALIAGIGIGLYPGYQDLPRPLMDPLHVTHPAHQPAYEDSYQRFCALYPLLKTLL